MSIIDYKCTIGYKNLLQGGDKMKKLSKKIVAKKAFVSFYAGECNQGTCNGK